MPRAILAETNIHPAVRDKIARHQSAIVREVQEAVAAHPVVVVGMGINPFPRKARRLLDEAGVPYHYISYGSYFSKWRERNALKMWTGSANPADGVRAGHADRRSRRSAEAHRERRVAQAGGRHGLAKTGDGALHAPTPERNALNRHGRFDTREAAQDHCRVHVAQVANAKRAARERTQTAGDRDLETLARDGAHRLRVDAWLDCNGRD